MGATAEVESLGDPDALDKTDAR